MEQFFDRDPKIRTNKGEVNMKLKAVVTEGIPPQVANALEDPSFLRKVLVRVIDSFLKVENSIGRPAEFYAQKNDQMVEIVPGYWGVEVRLTGVTARPDRNFEEALKTLFAMYQEAIENNLTKKLRVQLFCVIMVSDESDDRSSGAPKLYESEAKWIEGMLTLPWFTTTPE